MRTVKEVESQWQEEDSNPITPEEIIHENNALIQESNYNLTYHAKQLGKGLLVFGAGLLGYVGLSAFLGSKREASTLEAEHVVDGTLAVLEETRFNGQTRLSGLAPAPGHQEGKEFVPLSLSTARTLLSLQEQAAVKETKPVNGRAIRREPLSPFTHSAQRRLIQETDPGGSTFRVNTYTTSDQSYPAVTTLPAGGFVVVWQSFDQGGPNHEVYGQRYNATWQPEGTEFKVNTYTASDQWSPAVAAFPAGGFVVVWDSLGQDGSGDGVYGQRYNATTGLPVGPEFQVNNYTLSDQQYPAVTAFPTGGFVVVWTSNGQDGSNFGVYGQRYNATGLPVGTEFQVNNYTSSWQYATQVAAFPSGGFVVVWMSNGQDGSSWGIYGQRYQTTGQRAGPEFQVNTYTTSVQGNPAVTALPAGGFVVVWRSYGQEGGPQSYGVYGQRYNATGQRAGPEFQVNTYTTSAQVFPVVAALSTGGFVVVWQSNNQDGSSYGVYGQRYNATGDREDNEFQVSIYTVGDQRYPRVSPLNDGNFVVVWAGTGNSDGSSIYARISGLFIVNNQLTITESGRIPVTLNQLRASNMKGQPANTLVLTLTNVQHGRFEAVNQPDVALTSFTQQDINDNAIQFVHDGSNIAPSYRVKVNDGQQETPYQYGQITFIPSNDLPQIVNNQLDINQGASRILTSGMLSATDEETNDAVLVFTVRNATYGWFEDINNASTLIETFSQQDVMNGAVRFHQAGGNGQTPSYEIKVSDGARGSLYSSATITFTPNPNLDWVAPVLIASGLGAICLCVTAAASIFIITAGGIYIAKSKKYRKSLHDIELETLEGTVTLSPFLHQFNIDSSAIKLKEKIGQGGEAAVYLAKWSSKTVAYKVTRIIDASAIAEFETEAKIMLESNHPNIVHVYRICVTPKRIGLVMEFMALGSLKEAIKKKSIRLTWDTIWNIAYDLATVTAFLHEQDIVHRDIKTDNLLLYQDDGEIHAKLADFGLSKRKQVSDASVTMRIGTYKYMAPEMMLGDGHYSEKASDIYAVGMTFVALINEEEPYPKTRGEMFLPGAVGRGQVWQKLAKRRYDPAFFTLTDRCRSIHADERPTAKEIVKQLKEIEEELFDIFEENEILNQELSPPSENLPITIKATSISTATQTLFSVRGVEKRNSLDNFMDALNKQIEKAQNGKSDNTKLEVMKAKFQGFEKNFVSILQKQEAQQEQKEDTVNTLNISTVVRVLPMNTFDL